MIRRRLVNLAVSLASIALFLTVAEATMWAVNPPPKQPFPKGMFEPPGKYWRMTPNFTGLSGNRSDFNDKTVSADSLGRRVVPAAPTEADHRLWLFGDSQTFGHGLSDDETWANRLQEEFKRSNRSIQVINLGVPAINVDQYLARLRKTIDEIKPDDHVMVGLSWNDIITPQNVSARPAIAVIDGYLVNGDLASSQNSAKARVAFYDATGIAVPPFQDLKSFLDSMAHTSALMHFVYPRAKAVYYRYRPSRPLETIVRSQVPEANFYLLAEMAEMVRRQGAAFSLLILPDKIFFEDAAYAVYSVDGRDFPQQNYPGYLVQPLCRQHQITCLDAFDILHRHQHDPVAYAEDGHYNPQGARVIARWLAEQWLFRPTVTP